MTVPLGDPQDPLRLFLGAMRATERELARTLAVTASEASSIIKAAGTSPSSTVRRAQILASLNRMEELSDELWNGALKDALFVGKYRAADVAGKTAAQQLFAYMKQTGRARFMTLAQWEASLRSQALSGIEATVSQAANDIPLSKLVYRNKELQDGKIRDIVRTRLATGASARDIATAVKSFIRPDVPGGVSYAAMRLGRTELNNAFHTSTIGRWADNPFVTEMIWRLSGSHPRPDICNELEANGPYPPKDVPGKPHPNCFCVIIPGTPGDPSIEKNFREGRYDDWLDAQLDSAQSPIGFSDTGYATILQQRRVMFEGKAAPIKEVPESQGSRFYTAEEKRLLREEGQWPW
jgi:hypothetical protein